MGNKTAKQTLTPFHAGSKCADKTPGSSVSERIRNVHGKEKMMIYIYSYSLPTPTPPPHAKDLYARFYGGC